MLIALILLEIILCIESYLILFEFKTIWIEFRFLIQKKRKWPTPPSLLGCRPSIRSGLFPLPHPYLFAMAHCPALAGGSGPSIGTHLRRARRTEVNPLPYLREVNPAAAPLARPLVRIGKSQPPPLFLGCRHPAPCLTASVHKRSRTPFARSRQAAEPPLTPWCASPRSCTR